MAWSHALAATGLSAAREAAGADSGMAEGPTAAEVLLLALPAFPPLERLKKMNFSTRKICSPKGKQNFLASLYCCTCGGEKNFIFVAFLRRILLQK